MNVRAPQRPNKSSPGLNQIQLNPLKASLDRSSTRYNPINPYKLHILWLQFGLHNVTLELTSWTNRFKDRNILFAVPTAGTVKGQKINHCTEAVPCQEIQSYLNLLIFYIATKFLTIFETMSESSSAKNILDREFLETRAKLLELAASLDRLDRATGSVREDPRTQDIQQALAILIANTGDRAEQIQLIFSLSYQPDWRSHFGLQKPST